MHVSAWLILRDTHIGLLKFSLLSDKNQVYVYTQADDLNTQAIWFEHGKCSNYYWRKAP